MAKQPTAPAKTGKPKTGGQLVMRDESDEIIDGLKRQLQALQEELSAYRAGGGAHPEPTEALLRAWGEEFPPFLASRLRVPAEDLSERLNRVIAQVGDPGLRRELEKCRDTAALLSGTFRRIQDNHRLLTASLAAEKMELPVEAFCRQIENALRERGHQTPRIDGLEPGATLRVAAGAACAVVATLTELVTTLFGPPVLTRIDLAGAKKAGVFRLHIATPRPWHEVESEEVSELVLREGVQAHSIVDLLYVEKIAELQGATVRYLKEQGAVHGLEVTWPSA